MQNQKERPRVRLPFERRKTDLGTWAYIHRAGLCATIAMLLIFGIAFVAWRIGFGDSMAHQVVYIAMEPPPEEQMPPEPKEVAPLDYGNISNRTSNENAELNDEELSAAAQDAGDLMGANRAAYEEGMLREQQMIDAARARANANQGEPRSARREGSVTASYSFADPVRHDMRLDIPAYRCMTDGRVVVAATLDRNGRVVAAEVAGGSSSDPCLHREALRSANASRFNLDASAPARHRGTITYLFQRQ